MVNVKNDLTGKVFGRLTVLEQAEDYVEPKGKHYARWLCKCNCKEQNLTYVVGYNLTSGKIKSCGCIRKENTTKFNKTTKKKYNEYNFDNEYGIGYCSNTGNEFYFDWEDFDLIKEYCWNEHIKTTGYHMLEAYDRNNKNIVPMIHVLGLKGYDHKNRNPLDNRRENLRAASQKENVRNKTIQKNNQSGFIGVSYMKNIDRWIARIICDGKRIHLGTFKNKEDAIKERLKAEKKYFGDFAPQQHLFEQYEII